MAISSPQSSKPASPAEAVALAPPTCQHPQPKLDAPVPEPILSNETQPIFAHMKSVSQHYDLSSRSTPCLQLAILVISDPKADACLYRTLVPIQNDQPAQLLAPSLLSSFGSLNSKEG